MSNSYKKDSFLINTQVEYTPFAQKVISGSVGAGITVFWNDKNSFDLDLETLQKGHIIGAEYLFAPANLHHYYFRANSSVETQTISLNMQDFFKLSPAESLTLLHEILETSLLFEKTYLDLRTVYQLVAGVNNVLKAGAVYIGKQFAVSLEFTDSQFLHSMESYIEKNQLKDKLFPLGSEFLNIDFTKLTKIQFMDFYVFFKYISRLQSIFPQMKSALLEKDKTFRNYTIENLATRNIEMFDSFNGLMKETVHLLKEIIEPKSLLEAYFEVLPKLERNNMAMQYVQSILNFAMGHLTESVVPSLQKYSHPFGKFIAQKIESFSQNMRGFQLGGSSGGKSFSIVPKVSSNIPPELGNSLFQIIEYSQISKEIESRFMEHYSKWLIFENKLSAEEDLRRLRNRINEYFWIFYAEAFVQYKVHHKPLTKTIELFFRYGFFDETLVNAEIINHCLAFKQKKAHNKDLLIYDLFEWLVEVSEKRAEPSLDAMGETYQKFLKALLDDAPKKDVTIETLDTPEQRIRFEVGNLAKESSKICSGDIASFTPILLEEHFQVHPIYQLLQQYDIFQKAFYDIREIDFAAFYREIRFKGSGYEEFIQSEILPVIILLPMSGKRAMVWQPKERLKESKGRIILPFLCTNALNRVMVNAFGFYRWEIVKELLGPLWNDISQLSLTAEYTDYIRSVKKNKELSEETRERVLLEFKRFRSDRDRFVNDYSRWILLESNGRPGVNKVLRAIFFRQIPFPKELREKLVRNGTFAELGTKYNNIINKELNALKLKYQKYIKQDGELPAPLEEYLDFIKR